MKVLTMTRILSDVDTVAMMGYNDANDKGEFVRDYCRETYGTALPVLTAVVAKAFRETTGVFTGNREPRAERKSIGTEAIY